MYCYTAKNVKIKVEIPVTLICVEECLILTSTWLSTHPKTIGDLCEEVDEVRKTEFNCLKIKDYFLISMSSQN